MDSNRQLIDKVKEFNKNMNSRYKDSINMTKVDLRSALEAIGDFKKLKKDTPEDLTMACIDGSVNRMGGSFPHYIELYQGLGKISGGKDILATNVYSPIIDGGKEEEDQRSKLLASIEIEVALDIVKNYEIDLILMDGGLIRYSIDASSAYEELKSLCLDKKVILAGYIKEVKTNFLSYLLFPDQPIEIYDKDLLYGILEIGEMLTIGEDIQFQTDIKTKKDQGVHSAFFRMSSHPGVTGIDLLNEQKDILDDLANLCFSLCPSMGRGVPMIIDMVDSQVRLDDELTEEIIRTHVDPELYQRFFASERNLRTY